MNQPICSYCSRLITIATAVRPFCDEDDYVHPTCRRILLAEGIHDSVPGSRLTIPWLHPDVAEYLVILEARIKELEYRQ